MKSALIVSAFLATTSLAIPFHIPHRFDDIDWPWSRPFHHKPGGDRYPIGTPTPTPGYPTPVYGYPGYYTPTPTPTPSGGYGDYPYEPISQENTIYYHFKDAIGRTFFVYCTPRTEIDSDAIGAVGGPFVCGA